MLSFKYPVLLPTSFPLSFAAYTFNAEVVLPSFVVAFQWNAVASLLLTPNESVAAILIAAFAGSFENFDHLPCLNIDKLIKTYTTVKAPDLIKSVNETGTLNITVKNKKTGKVIKDLKLKIKIGNKTYSVTTNSKGVAKFNPGSLDVGKYNVTIYTNSIKYKVSAKSTITIA